MLLLLAFTVCDGEVWTEELKDLEVQEATSAGSARKWLEDTSELKGLKEFPEYNEPFGHEREMETYLNWKFGDELNDMKIELEWDENENAYAVEVDGETPTDAWLKDFAGDDGFMTETEWDVFWDDQSVCQIGEHYIPYWWGGIFCFGLIFVTAIITASVCRNSRVDQQVIHRHQEYPRRQRSRRRSRGHSESSDGYRYSRIRHRRRLPAHPALISNLPHSARSAQQISHRAHTIHDDTMYKMVGLSVIAQFAWLFLGYQVFKCYKRATKSSPVQGDHELREITVVRR